jgi:hypothetical protein
VGSSDAGFSDELKASAGIAVANIATINKARPMSLQSLLPLGREIADLPIILLTLL